MAYTDSHIHTDIHTYIHTYIHTCIHCIYVIALAYDMCTVTVLNIYRVEQKNKRNPLY